MCKQWVVSICILLLLLLFFLLSPLLELITEYLNTLSDTPVNTADISIFPIFSKIQTEF